MKAPEEKATVGVSVRLTPSEHAALQRLVGARVERAREAGFKVDPSLVAWLRDIIERETTALDIAEKPKPKTKRA